MNKRHALFNRNAHPQLLAIKDLIKTTAESLRETTLRLESEVDSVKQNPIKYGLLPKGFYTTLHDERSIYDYILNNHKTTNLFFHQICSHFKNIAHHYVDHSNSTICNDFLNRQKRLFSSLAAYRPELSDYSNLHIDTIETTIRTRFPKTDSFKAVKIPVKRNHIPDWEKFACPDTL